MLSIFFNNNTREFGNKYTSYLNLEERNIFVEIIIFLCTSTPVNQL